MADSPRLAELKRRVQQDPASIAFAALAEEYRRAGRFEEAIGTCTAGLQRHPSYLSAHVTLGRALIEVERYDEALEELQLVLRIAPENLAAIRGLAEINQRRGEDAAPAPQPTLAPPPPIAVAAQTPLRPIPVAAPASPPAIEIVPSPVTEVPPPAMELSPSEEVPPPLVIEVSPPTIDLSPPPVIEVTIPPIVEPAPPAAPHPALAGLESFLGAIVRARASARQ
jgi:tetratricopeptide (TPR) repeat protein